MIGDRTSGLIFDNPVRLAEMCRKAMEPCEMPAELVNNSSMSVEMKRIKMLQLENEKMLSLLRSICRLAEFSCKAGENSDNHRVVVGYDPYPLSLRWSCEKLVEGRWTYGLNGGLNWSESLEGFSINT